MFNFESEESSMHLESEHFIVDQINRIILKSCGSIIKARNIFCVFTEEMGNFAELYS